MRKEKKRMHSVADEYKAAFIIKSLIHIFGNPETYTETECQSGKKERRRIEAKPDHHGKGK